MPDFITSLLGELNAEPNPESQRFLNAWIRAEGTKAAFNPLATTQVAPGATSFNPTGVKNYPDFETGVRATAQTLLNPTYASGYGPIISGLRSGASATQLAEAVAASPWGTGRGVLNVLGSGGAPAQPPALAVPSSPPVPSTSTPVPAQPDLSGALIGTMGQSPGAQLQALMGAVMQARMAPVPAPGTEIAPPLGGVPPGSTTPPSFRLPSSVIGDPLPVKFQTSVGGEHETAGLPGYPARDFMGPAGAPVVAPVAGKVVRFSGHDPKGGPTEGVHGPFGWSLYLQGDNGRSYYLTHLGARDVKVGQRVDAGQQIGTIGDYARFGGANHVHMGVTAPIA